MADKPSRVGKSGPKGSSGSEENSSHGSLTVSPITNRGVPGGRDLSSLVNAEKVSVPGVDFAKKGSSD